jgi:ATP-dependent DNA helicase RecG
MLNISEETGLVEFKRNAPRDSDLAARICGMANSRKGGTILFGVEDATGRVVGLAKPHATIDAITRALRLVKPAVPLAGTGPEVIGIDNLPLVALTILPNNGELYQAGGTFWIRRGSQTFPMTRAEIEEHLHSSGVTHWERTLCLRATLADLDMDLVNRYLVERATRRGRPLGPLTPEEMLIGMECAGRDPATGELHPTNAGLLFFGRDPQLYLPHSEVVCILYPDPIGLKRWIDRQICQGTLPEIIDQTFTFLHRHISVSAEIRGFHREDRPEYPLEALREAVVNAVAHRDYARLGESIRVFIYPDRIEVHSPGLLLPGITPEDLAQMRVPSRPRNPLIAQLFRDMPGYMERVGAGIRLMIHEMRAWGLRDPDFMEQQEVIVIFRNDQPAGGDVTGQLNTRQLQAWRIVQEAGSISTGEYVTATGISERTAYRELNEMVAWGILERRGKRRAARYYRP